MADKKTNAPKPAATAVKTKLVVPTPVQIACVQAGFNYDALSEAAKKELETVASSLNKLGNYFSPEILLAMTKSLVASGSIEVTIIKPKAEPKPNKEN